VLVRVLFVEDVETDAELAVRRLRTDGVPCEYKRVETEQAYLDALRTGGHDIILSDFSLPQFDGMSALALAKREQPAVPFIFVSGTIGEERAIEALRCGAVDYVLKSNLKRLAPAVTRALREAEQQLERVAQQARIERLTRILEMLSGINTAVVRIRERLELLHEACRIAVTIGHYVTALVSFIEPGTRTARPCTWAGKGDEQMGSLVFAIAACEEEDSSFTGRVLRTGQVFLCNDIARADRIVSRLTSTHKRGKREGHIVAVGSEFHNLRVLGHELKVTLRHKLLSDSETFEHLRNKIATDKDSGKIAVIDDGVAVCSLVERIDTDLPGVDPRQHIFRVPNFGKFSLAEVFAEHGRRVLTMIRLELGSPHVADLTVAEASTNGKPSPPLPPGS